MESFSAWTMQLILDLEPSLETTSFRRLGRKWSFGFVWGKLCGHYWRFEKKILCSILNRELLNRNLVPVTWWCVATGKKQVVIELLFKYWNGFFWSIFFSGSAVRLVPYCLNRPKLHSYTCRAFCNLFSVSNYSKA